MQPATPVVVMSLQKSVDMLYWFLCHEPFSPSWQKYKVSNNKRKAKLWNQSSIDMKGNINTSNNPHTKYAVQTYNLYCQNNTKICHRDKKYNTNSFLQYLIKEHGQYTKTKSGQISVKNHSQELRNLGVNMESIPRM